MKAGALRLEVHDSLFEPGRRTRTIESEKGAKTLYRVWLYLDGADLPYVEAVTYRLHSTFPERNKRVARTPANPHCVMPIWTWGLFVVVATIEDKSGATHVLRHPLRWDRDLKAASA